MTVRTFSVIANYPIEEFVEKRAEISNKINAAFIAKTANSGIAVKSFLMNTIKLLRVKK